MNSRLQSVLAKRQRGAVAVMTGLTLAVLIGFLGISVDLGRLFVAKAQLQTAMDACALAAATGLRGDADSLARAAAYGKAAAADNRVGFQDSDLVVADIDFAFGSKLGTWDENPATARYARCSYDLSGLVVYFMRVLNGPETAGVAAFATATMPPSNDNSCVFPVGLCAKNKNLPNGGLSTDDLLNLENNKNKLDAGKDFAWLDLDGHTGGGANDLGSLIKGGGYCGSLGTALIEPGTNNSSSVRTGWDSRVGSVVPAIVFDCAARKSLAQLVCVRLLARPANNEYAVRVTNDPSCSMPASGGASAIGTVPMLVQ